MKMDGLIVYSYIFLVLFVMVVSRLFWNRSIVFKVMIIPVPLLCYVTHILLFKGSGFSSDAIKLALILGFSLFLVLWAERR